VASATAELLETARVAARAASQLLAGARASDIRAKGNPRDLVTEWDLRSEEIIRTTLAERTPGIPLLAEEGGQTGAVTGRSLRWVVDPIDGTVNFAHGFPIWSVSIESRRRPWQRSVRRSFPPRRRRRCCAWRASNRQPSSRPCHGAHS